MGKTKTGIQVGKDIMLFVEDGGAFKPTAAATSHKISFKAESKGNKRVTKDTNASRWDYKQITGMSCSISISALYDATPDKVGYSMMKRVAKAGDPIKVKYGYSDQTGEYEEGLFVITSIDQDAPADGDASWSATLESTGEITTKTA